MTWPNAIILLFVYAHLAEYGLHRWVMHEKRRGWLRREYQAHHVEHHGRGRNDLNINAHPHVIFTVASPLLLICVWLGWPFAAVIAAFSGTYAAAWSLLHHAHHDLRFGWLHHVPGYSLWRDHHLSHHERPNRNFGTVFPWTDYIFGTKA
jgi:sterol desaturase/sphingolipid hydroxylase (fatty acid hydroxylase superfamily)